MVDPVANSPTPARQLLSDEYRRLNAELHERVPTYGTTGRQYVDVIRRLAREHEAHHILDYGCGKRDLSTALGREFDVRDFDPAIAGLDIPPEPADLVACIDVLEHVEPECLENVLTDLARVMLKVGFLAIATKPSGKQLADGTNAHRIVERPEWWLERLGRHFRLAKTDIPTGGNGVQVIVAPISTSLSGVITE